MMRTDTKRTVRVQIVIDDQEEGFATDCSCEFHHVEGMIDDVYATLASAFDKTVTGSVLHEESVRKAFCRYWNETYGWTYDEWNRNIKDTD